MYLDDILTYKRVVIGCTIKHEDQFIANQILSDVSNYIGDKCTIVTENDSSWNKSVLENEFVVSYKSLSYIIKSTEFLRYGDNFIISKTFLGVNMGNSNYQLSNNILYSSDLVLYLYDEKIHVIKDRNILFINRDMDRLYDEITIGRRSYKINKILKRNERFTNGRQKDILYITA